MGGDDKQIQRAFTSLPLFSSFSLSVMGISPGVSHGNKSANSEITSLVALHSGSLHFHTNFISAAPIFVKEVFVVLYAVITPAS